MEQRSRLAPIVIGLVGLVAIACSADHLTARKMEQPNGIPYSEAIKLPADVEEGPFAPRNPNGVGVLRDARASKAGSKNEVGDEWCGADRWKVKTLGDPDVASIEMKPKKKSVRQLNAEGSACGLVQRNTERSWQNEFQTFEVTGIVVKVIHEADEDYHVVLQDLDSENDTMVVEIPDPGCLESTDTTINNRIDGARSTIDKLMDSIEGKKVTVVGVGFYDIVNAGHQPTGMGPNCMELHPVLDFECDDCAQ